MKTRLVFATNNQHKLEEIKGMLPGSFELLGLKDFQILHDLEESGNTLIDNALQKARFVYSNTQHNCFADDTGLEVMALDNAPGVYSSRYAGEERNAKKNMELLLKNMEGVSDRRARFRTVIALIFNGEEYIFEGAVEGEITLLPMGNDGFGYDPIFKPFNYNQTFAQLDLGEKNRISHRGHAFRNLIAFFNRNTL